MTTSTTTTAWRAALTLLLGIVSMTVIVPAPAPAAVQHRHDLLRYFAEAGTTGTMIVRLPGPGGQTIVVGARRSRVRYPPSSTFKIPNSLLAIEYGVATGAAHAYPGPNPNYVVDGAPLLPPACEGDLTLASAFAFSCIPIYQRIARQLGLATYRRELHAMRYGTRRLDGAQVESFWLHGPLAISAREQVRFLERLRRGALPLSERAMSEVREMMVLERSDAAVLRGKTGYVFSTSPRVGWWVGWVERGDRSWSFALNLDVTAPGHLAARQSIGRAILRELGAL